MNVTSKHAAPKVPTVTTFILITFYLQLIPLKVEHRDGFGFTVSLPPHTVYMRVYLAVMTFGKF